MPRGSKSKVWNEDLLEACRAREAQCRQQGSARQYLWRDAATVVEGVRKDIYAFSNGRIVNFPRFKQKTAEELLRRVVLGLEPVLPPGYVAAAAQAPPAGSNPYLDDPYLRRIKMKSGAFAILMAFHVSQKDVMTKQEICRLGQPFCDEPMDTNYLQGRPYGGWSSIDTLTKHRLVLRDSNVVYQQAVGGLRNLGPHSFSLTTQGRRFIEALLDTRPECREILRLVTGRDDAAVPMARVASVSRWGAESDHDFPYEAVEPSTPSLLAGAGSPLGSLFRRVTPLMNDHEAELKAWAETARVGQQKVFACGKDRRRHLHNVCDELNLVLRLDGRRLTHESDGNDRSRSLYVTVRAVDQIRSSPARKRLEPAFAGSAAGGRVLGSGDGTPSKRSRQSAAQAAAEAALARHAIHASLEERKKIKPSTQLPSLVERRAIEVIEIPDASPPKDRTAADRRREISTPSRRTAARQAESLVRDVGDTDDDSVELIEPTGHSLIANRKVPARKGNAKPRGRHPEVVILDDSDDELPPPSCFAAASRTAATTAQNSKMDQDVYILIDSRERDRNATPRTMRMALTQMLSQSGTLSTVWPRSWKLPVVEEQTLPVGDFAFDLENCSGQRYRVPVHVERKRVSDLVQRSAKKDHWKQLQRMKSLGGVDGSCIFLIEGDLRTAERFTAYGAQEMDLMSRNNFAIQDQDAAVRFIGRAVLSCKCLRVIQTNAEVATYEAIASVAMVASSLYSERNHAPHVFPNVDADRGKLMGFLHDGGLLREIARGVADEFGSLEQLRSLYDRVEKEDVRDALLEPIIEDIVRGLESSSSAHSWSSAIHKVVCSALEDAFSAKALYDDWKSAVDDEARLLGLLHAGTALDQAVDMVLSGDGQASDTPLRRLVQLGLPKAMEHLFRWAVESDVAFYRIHERKPSPRIRGIPSVSIRTVSGSFASDSMLVFILDGSEFVRRLQDSIEGAMDNCMQACRSVATGIVKDCHAIDFKDGDTRILLLHGLQPALDQAAKKPGFFLQSRAAAHTILAEIMLVHDMVVLQAVRKTNDCEMMLQQLLLSCYHYQLLTHKRMDDCEAKRAGTGN